MYIDAEQGNTDAQEYLTKAYYYARGVKRDYFKAIEWFKKAAEQGNVSAQESLAEMYEQGKGVERNINEAIKWYQKVEYQK